MSEDLVFPPQYSYSSVRPTARLRFVEREGKRILQQRWLTKNYDTKDLVMSAEEEWRDVPLESEAPDDSERCSAGGPSYQEEPHI